MTGLLILGLLALVGNALVFWFAFWVGAVVMDAIMGPSDDARDATDALTSEVAALREQLEATGECRKDDW